MLALRKNKRSRPRRIALGVCASTLAACSTTAAVAPEKYAYAPASAAHAAGSAIDLARENAPVSRFLLGLPLEERARRPLIVVPGFSPVDDSRAEALPRESVRRIELALAAFEELDGLAILVSGGNVHPPTTPFNEAYGMKQHLIRDWDVPEERVALEPYARHTTTNLRNAARFALAHDVPEAVVVTTKLQSFYVSYGPLSGYTARCKRELGYTLGELKRVTTNRTLFRPGPQVFERGDDPLDP